MDELTKILSNPDFPGYMARIYQAWVNGKLRTLFAELANLFGAPSLNDWTTADITGLLTTIEALYGPIRIDDPILITRFEDDGETADVGGADVEPSLDDEKPLATIVTSEGLVL